jgi:cytochrome c
MHRLHRLLVITLLGSATAGPAFADQALLQKHNCFACHGIDKRKYGPNLNEVAAKYAKNPKATELLARKIRKGGTGVWGKDVMPPQATVSQADARTLAKFILSLEPTTPP